ncbi:hypothetical protein T07_9959, partial [Trichinella nelsoni]
MSNISTTKASYSSVKLLGEKKMDFRHSSNRLSQRRAKLYCSEISKKLFPGYHDRKRTEQTCSNVYIHSDFSIDIDL